MRLLYCSPIFLSIIALSSGVSTTARECLASTGVAAYKAERLQAPPPKEVPESLRDAFEQSGYRVLNPAGKPICEIWLRKEISTIPDFKPKLDLSYPLKPGTLVGAIRFPSDSSDFRKTKIVAGTYSLRYQHQPQDGNHLGTSDLRDFLVLCPCDKTMSLKELTEEETNKLSTKVSRKSHPAIMSLMPPQKADKIPSMWRDDFGELEVLVIQGRVKGQEKPLQLELVAVGHAEE